MGPIPSHPIPSHPITHPIPSHPISKLKKRLYIKMKKEKRRKTYQFQSHFPKFFGCTFRICWPHRQIHHFLFIGSIKSSRNFQSIGTSSSPNSAYSLILDHFEVLTPSTVLNSAKSQKNKANHPKGTPESNSSRNFAVERPIQMKNNNIFVKKTNK